MQIQTSTAVGRHGGGLRGHTLPKRGSVHQVTANFEDRTPDHLSRPTRNKTKLKKTLWRIWQSPRMRIKDVHVQSRTTTVYELTTVGVTVQPSAFAASTAS
jgi:hypothetical protein